MTLRPKGPSWPYPIRGVFSSQKVTKVGTGVTQRRTIQKTYWSAQELAEGEVEIQPLGPSFTPAGPTQKIPKGEFLLRFQAEPEFYLAKVYPAQGTTKPLDTPPPRPLREKTQPMDEETLKACFSLGVAYLQRGEKDKAEDIFLRIARLDAVFAAEHKHLFNELAIKLRQQGLLEEAMRYYDRALDLATNDEHLHLNRARACFEQGDTPACQAELEMALRINPVFPEALLFKNFLERGGVHKESTAAASKNRYVLTSPRPQNPSEGRSATPDLSRRPFAGTIKRRPSVQPVKGKKDR